MVIDLAARLGAFGVRSGELRRAGRAEAAEAAAEAEALRFGAVWMPGLGADDLEAHVRALLEATRTLIVATGVASIWEHAPEVTGRRWASIEADHPGRFVLGLGVSHPVLVERRGARYGKPLTMMREYLDALPVPPEAIVLGALGPRMLDLARERTSGSHPFLVAPDHTRWARERLGEGRVLAPDQKVVLDADPMRARAAGREAMSFHITLPNYRRNFLRSGFTEADLEGGGSDALIDRMVAWGSAEDVRARLAEHRAAGADHAVLEIVAGADLDAVREGWRALAPSKARV
jgi:probable F420-dependent oxidoreductase